MILDDGDDELELKIQSDDKGKKGDVRDVLIIRQGIEGEIGLSVKHNYFAVKHSRISENLDFGNKWYGVDCSKQYWEDIKPIFKLPISTLPTRIVSLEYKPGSKNTLELYLNGDWQFSFRIHNASTKVETSLKFDIQIISMPTTIISIDCRWKQNIEN